MFDSGQGVESRIIASCNTERDAEFVERIILLTG